MHYCIDPENIIFYCSYVSESEKLSRSSSIDQVSSPQLIRSIFDTSLMLIRPQLFTVFHGQRSRFRLSRISLQDQRAAESQGSRIIMLFQIRAYLEIKSTFEII
jgi:hypothetical protein